MSKQSYTIEWQKFRLDMHTLGKQLALHQPDCGWKGIIAITRGGLMPAGLLSYALDLTLVETVCINSYQDQLASKPKLIKKFNLDNIGDGDGFIIVDELVDTGNTIRLIKSLLPNAKVAVPYVKPASKELADFYVEDFPQDYWLYFPWDNNKKEK